MQLEHDSWFGSVEQQTDWRKLPADPVPDDDAERATPADVIAILGFDPADDDDVEKAWDESKHPRGKTSEPSTPGSFAPAGSASEFVEARAKSSRGGFLSPVDPSGLAGHQLFTNKEGTVGYGIDPDGDIQNLFNNGGPKGAGGKALIDAIERGGRTLDCYDGFLPRMYRQFGFEETGRMHFNDQFAPSGWNFDTDGRPDVVFMGWKGYDGGPEQSLARAADKSQATWIKNERSTRYGNDWDEHKQRSREEAEWGKTGAKSRRAEDH